MPEQLTPRDLDFLIHFMRLLVGGWMEQSLAEATVLLRKLERLAADAAVPIVDG